MCKKNGFEILSPAGSLEILKAAVANGADAVYIGGTRFSARKNARNFTDEEITEGIRFAHLYGVKVYAAVNILINESELNSLFEYIEFLYSAGTDALIVQDLGIVYIVKKYFPGFDIHASTQMTIHNLEGAKAAKRLGFSRAVLSRELTFDEIKYIHDNCDIELEVFVHGALCMSYSGQCLMSSFLGCRSGNRGACAQPCRLPYMLLDSRHRPLCRAEKYPLSLKDLCLADEMNRLKECGVMSLKIEGRMKSAEYVSIVTSVYDKYRSGGRVSETDMQILKNIFSRSGFTKGYLFGETGRNMLNYDKNNDDVYKNIDLHVAELAKRLKEKQPKKIPVSADVRIELGKPVYAKFICKNKECEIRGTICTEKAVNKPLTYERAEEQLKKTGNTPFEIEKLGLYIEEGITVPIRELNDIRRSALKRLEDMLCASERSSVLAKFEFEREKGDHYTVAFKAEVRNMAQAKAAVGCGFDKIIVPYSLYDKNRSFFDGEYKEKTAVLLPRIQRDNKACEYRINTDEVYVSNISQFAGFKDKKITADYSMNVFNSPALRILKMLGADAVCISPELNINQVGKIDSYILKEYIVYGRISLMTVQNCVVKSVKGKCGCTDAPYYLKDRKGVDFPLFTNKENCTNTICNSKPVYMADRLDEMPVSGTGSFRFIFTTESETEIEQIFSDYKNKRKSTGDFTRGHYYRGV